VSSNLSTGVFAADEVGLEEVKILVLDNNRDDEQLLCPDLEGRGYKDVRSCLWKDAEHVFKDFYPDILISAVMHPQSEGLGILKNLVLDDDRVESIIITDNNEKELSIEALRLGICDLLTYPICPDDLKRSLSRATKRIFFRKKQSLFISRVDTLTREKNHMFFESDIDFIPKTIVQGSIHNLNNPLSAISGNAQLLEMGLEDIMMYMSKNNGRFETKIYDELFSKIVRLSSFLSNVLDSTDRMRDLIVSFLTKWRKENNSQEDIIDINEFLKLELNYLDCNAVFKNKIKKTYEFSDAIPSILAVYPDFSQTFHNLVNNAIDAMHDSDHKELKIISRYDEEYIFIEIHDTGCGISEDNQKEIFSDFFTTKEHIGGDNGGPKGTGLGLPNCVELMKPYGAEFLVDSEIGKGTCIIWKIPMKKKDEDAPHESRL